ncbi:unnamed protein product [Porites evermanni]|uniref:Uncharacterized protein n=1 Tax=Porites evermanni TaxID=104178 RepID=A0ABN8RGI2_9CNID|nr:unnamed protein product [Porites evermanni]
MDRCQVYENFLYVAALAAACCVLVPVKLNESDTNGNCLLFAELNVLTNTVATGNNIFCSLAFYAYLVNAALAAVLGFLKSCCIVTTERLSAVYFLFASSIVSALVWISCLVYTIFIVIGLTEWCNSVENNGNVESCKDAEKWDWTLFSPTGIDGSKFYTHLFMAEIASIASVVIWFIILILSGRNFKQSLLNVRAAEYYLNEERMSYMYPPPIQDIPVYEVKSDGGSRFL